MNSWAQGEGQPGLGYIFWRDGEEGGAGRWRKTSGRSAPTNRRSNGPQGRRRLFLCCRKAEGFRQIRRSRAHKSGEELGLIAKDRFDFCWIVDFPMFEWNEEDKKIDFSHNPFSMPNMDVDEFLALDPKDHDKLLAIKAIQYDIVCNGTELSSGAIRNHRPRSDEEGFRHRRL